MVSNQSLANQNLPAPFSSLDQLKAAFAAQGLSTTDLVALSVQTTKFMKAMLLFLIMWITFHGTEAQTLQTAKLFVNVSNSQVKKIPETFMGVFFEEINHAGAGGLWAELVNNRGFEAVENNVPSNIHPWTVIGDNSSILVSIDQTSCFERNKNALRMEVHCDSSNSCLPDGVGISNPGFWGMNIEKGKKYKVVFYVRSTEGIDLKVSFVGTNGVKLASSDIRGVGVTVNASTWRRVERVLEANETNHYSSIQITATGKGMVWLDQVSAMPLDTYKGHGFRMDLFQMVAELKPRVFRFPGGCYVEGEVLKNAFQWKQTVGPWENRPGHYGDVWDYWTDDGFGFFEGLQLAEDLNALPIWVFNNGISHKEQLNVSAIAPFVQDALDGIEFAIGSPTSRWGSIRASMGHPEPFNLRYVAVGNEDCDLDNLRPFYLASYPVFYNSIKRAYPNIQIISNCDASKHPLNHPADLYDYHQYPQIADYMFHMAQDFDHASRTGPKAFVSEYALIKGEAGNGTLLAAVAEAGFLIGLEKNSDVVSMVNYAPLFVNVNDRRWTPDAIVFDSHQVYGTPSYWVIKFFKESSGATFLNSTLQFNSSTLAASAISWTSSVDGRPVLRIKQMSSQGNEEPTQAEANTTQAESNATQAEANTNQEEETQAEPIVGRKRKKTSDIWDDFDEKEVSKGVLKAVCKHCATQYTTGKVGSSTSQMRRHLKLCFHKKVKESKEKKQVTIPFKRVNSGNPFITSGVGYSNEKMREIIATAVMVHEYPFSVVEDDVWMWAFEYANPDFRKVTHKTTRSDCLALFENEKKLLKKHLESVGKISLTTDMWKSSHQVIEYMVITGHFIDAGWNLQKRVLSFVKVPAPRRGIDVADAIYKCLKTWGIENKIFSVSVDNASYNDTCMTYLKENLSLTRKLILNGSLFHVRCCAHILNLLVQDGLGKIKDIIFNIRESVKYVNHNDARLKAFCDVVEQKGLKERKLVLDCPTRWNSTFNMLSTALNFKIAFAAYKEREPHYDHAPSPVEWDKVEKVCKLLEVFNSATYVISGSEYPTANLYLSEVWKVKEILDMAEEDEDVFMREMASPMKKKFDKYWGDSNLLMAIASVLDPRCKLHMVLICFPKIYKSKEVSDENIEKVKSSLEALYEEYVALSLDESSSSQAVNLNSNNPPSSQGNVKNATGFAELLKVIQEKQAISPMKSELQDYLAQDIYIPDTETFSALDWWRNNSMKYKILSKMAADILAIPISTVASESTFSAGGRVIDEFRSKLKEDSVEALICGGDWFRHKYDVNKKSKVEKDEIEITLKI